MESPQFIAAIPILRSFDAAMAHRFYIDWLGFTVDWQHRFHDGMPLYMQISRTGLRLHISEHFGDATPGSAVFLPMQGIDALHHELITLRPNPNMRPGLETLPWGRQIEVTDPFANRIRFCEQREDG